MHDHIHVHVHVRFYSFSHFLFFFSFFFCWVFSSSFFCEVPACSFFFLCVIYIAVKPTCQRVGRNNTLPPPPPSWRVRRPTRRLSLFGKNTAIVHGLPRGHGVSFCLLGRGGNSPPFLVIICRWGSLSWRAQFFSAWESTTAPSTLSTPWYRWGHRRIGCALCRFRPAHTWGGSACRCGKNWSKIRGRPPTPRTSWTAVKS